MGAFAGSTLLAGRLSIADVASHNITLNLASLSFMIPLGVASAASTRVGNLIGARDPPGVRRASRTALAMGAFVMALTGLAFVTLREVLPRLYTVDPAVIAMWLL